jgi:hypothetical protein
VTSSGSGDGDDHSGFDGGFAGPGGFELSASCRTWGRILHCRHVEGRLWRRSTRAAGEDRESKTSLGAKRTKGCMATNEHGGVGVPGRYTRSAAKPASPVTSRARSFRFEAEAWTRRCAPIGCCFHRFRRGFGRQGGVSCRLAHCKSPWRWQLVTPLSATWIFVIPHHIL